MSKTSKKIEIPAVDRALIKKYRKFFDSSNVEECIDYMNNEKNLAQRNITLWAMGERADAQLKMLSRLAQKGLVKDPD